MLLHVHSSGAIDHISKLYQEAGIPARFINAAYSKPRDLIGCETIVVDSLRSLSEVGRLVANTKLYEGGKPTFKSMMGSSIITHVKDTGRPIRLMIGLTPKQLYTKQNKIIYHKLLKKITHPNKYAKISDPQINEVTSDKNIMILAENRARSLGGEIVMIGLDTETKQEGIITGANGESYWIYNMIELVQATFATKLPDGSYDLFTVVIPFKTKRQYEQIIEITSSDYPKIMSNGHYDMEQFIHWQIPVVNYAWDVEYYLRSISADFTGYYKLGMNAALWNLNIKAWKDLTDHKTDRNESQHKAFILYSGLDTHWTVATAINQMLSASGQNLKNYIMKQEFDGLTSFMNLQLLNVDEEVNFKLLQDATEKRIKNTEWFKDATGLKPSQNVKLLPLFKTLHFNMRKLGYPDMGKLQSLQEKNLSGIINSHPFWSGAVEKFLDAKHGEKDGSTFLQYIKYYRADDLKRKQPYFDYSMSQYTTMTLRYASSSSHAWCGGNVQNISGYYRQQYVIPKGQVGFSVDAPQSEARTVGYLAQCLTIINVLEDPNLDYHIFNAASAVFKKGYDTITKDERKLSKPVGFGFFYGQTWVGLLATLGVKSARELRAKMNLPNTIPLPYVAKQASLGIDKLYWEIRKNYYPKVIEHYRLTSRVPTITGYAPLVFGDINKGETVRTVVCIDGQHTSAHINMIGGVRMLYGFLYGKSPIERDTYPYLQLHDEIQGKTKDTYTVKEIDDYTEKLFKNEYTVNNRKMSIPRGIPVFGRSLMDLKGDEIERTEEVLSKQLKDMVD